ncbi:MAG TPA: hypothetical protein VHG93_05235, partial [Longimicrobium sp.]|nr:hypothetical protein [Longimicrobium sp.]
VGHQALHRRDQALELLVQRRVAHQPALYEEFQRLVTTMQRLMADIQANPAKYIGELQVF